MNWTDERVALLTKLWEEGVSASQIAEQLGGVTRNAVIGKVHRLKISRPDKTAENKKTKAGTKAAVDAADAGLMKNAQSGEGQAKAKATEPKRSLKKNDADAPSLIRKAANDSLGAEERAENRFAMGQGEEEMPSPSDAPSINGEKRHGEQLDDDVVVPISRRLTLLQLTENTCKWPIGDPLGAGFHFCGAKTCEGSPYCSYHSKIAFQPVAERRRVRV